MESVLKRSVAELKAVLLRFPFRLTLQELLEGVFWKAGPQLIEQLQGKPTASIGECFASDFGEKPAIAGPSWPAGTCVGSDESILGQGTEMTAHRLH